MKFSIKLFSALIIVLFVFSACNKSSETKTENNSNKKIQYDSLKAYQYGADDYGMKKYVMAFLLKGPNRDLDSAKRADLQKAHLKNIMRMAEAGKLVLAGPFFGSGEIRGIYVFNVQSLEEAKALTNTDPAVQAGSLVMDLMEWYGPAALMEINELNNTLAKKRIVAE